MAKYAQIGDKFYTVGDNSQLQQISESDIINRRGTVNGGRATLDFIRSEGDLATLDPSKITIDSSGAVLYGGQQLALGGSGAMVPRGSDVSYLGIAPVNQDYAQYLQATQQEQGLRIPGQEIQDTRAGIPLTPTQRFPGTSPDDFARFAQQIGFQINPQTGEVINPTQELINEFDRRFSTTTGGGQVFRDQNDNFYINGRKIEQPEFQSLGINADFVPRGSTVSLGQAKTGTQPVASGGTGVAGGGAGTSTGAGAPGTSGIGDLPPEYQQLYSQLENYLNKLQARGEVINPNVTITPEQIAQFTAQAQKEIDPYYSTQLKLAREGLFRDLGYSSSQILQQESELERKYRTNLRTLGEQSAEQGFAQSGRRGEAERELAFGTQENIDRARAQYAHQAGTAARSFAQQYGATALGGVPTMAESPRVLSGEGGFQRTGRELPFYELSPSTYEGLVGTQEFQQRADVRNRASQLEEAERQRLATSQTRQLTL